MTRKLFSLLLLAALWALSPQVRAQDARAQLDRCAAALRSAAAWDATFEATQFNGTQPAGTASGSITLQGRKFVLQSPAGTTWFDGRTQWALTKRSGEVYLSEPTDEELQSINPYTFLDLYKSGYKATQRAATYEGKPCQEVRLVSTSKGVAIAEMRIIIDPATHHPRSIRMRQRGGNWFRLRIKALTATKARPDAFFRYNGKAHPEVEVIDLR